MPTVSIRLSQSQLNIIDEFKRRVFPDRSRSNLIKTAALQQAKRLRSNKPLLLLRSGSTLPDTEDEAVVINIYLNEDHLTKIDEAASLLGHKRSVFMLFSILAEIENNMIFQKGGEKYGKEASK